MIKYIDSTRMYEEVRHKLQPRSEEVYQSGMHFPDKYCGLAEDLLKEMSGRKYAWLVTSGTAGILAMFLANKIQPGSTIACTNYSCPATVMPINLIGAKPVFFDVNEYGQQTHDDRLNDCDYIMATGLYGDTYDHDEFVKYGKPIMNDSAQSFGAKYKGIESLALGEMSIISFSTNKNCPIYGTYGAVLTDDDELAERLRLIRRNGYENRDVALDIPIIGMNLQPHEDKAAQVLTSLEFLPDWQRRRAEINDYLEDQCKKIGLSTRPTPDYSTRNYHKFMIFVKNNRQFVDAMAGKGVNCQLHYTYNFAKTTVFESKMNTEYPGTEWWRQHAVTIPSNPWLTTKELETIIQALKDTVTEEDLGLCLT